MPRPATGQVVRRASGAWALRFRAGGLRQYVTLGTAEEGWTRKTAEAELQNVLADVRRGIWRAPAVEPPAVMAPDPTFHEFATQWFRSTRGEWRPSTQLDYEWQLSNHLLPFFKDRRLSQITVAEVDRYRQAKVKDAQAVQAAKAAGRPLTEEVVDRRGRRFRRERQALSAASINKTITRLAQILDVAVEYELIERNPAKGKRRRLKAPKAAPVWLDRAGHIAALIDAAGELDREARADRQVPRRAILSTLVFAGLRIGELLDLRWRDVDLAGNRIVIRAGKTSASARRVELLPVLRDELTEYKARSRSTTPADRVFATQTGGPMNPSNVRNRTLARAVERANVRLGEAEEVPLPDGLTPHKLRHTFASTLVALGVDPGSVMDQLGHTDPSFTLRIYRHGMRRDSESKTQLRALIEGAEWAPTGTGSEKGPSKAIATTAGPEPKPAQLQAIPSMGPAGFEPATSRV
jgi:integrase